MATKERKRCVFTKEETMLIINLWKDEKIQAKFRTTLKHNYIWELISKELSEFGYIKTGDEIKRKISNLKHEYKSMKQLPGYDVTTWTYYKVMHDIMEKRNTEQYSFVADDHDYAEHESLDQSSSGWMLMELKDISQHTDENNFQVTEHQLIKHKLDIPNTNNMTIIDSKSKEDLSSDTRELSSQASTTKSAFTTKPSVKRLRKPLRYNADRKIYYSENRFTERLTSLQEREKRINEREKCINDRELRVEERQKRIDDRERRIDERERHLEDIERYIKERERRFEEREEKREERETRGNEAMYKFFDTCAQFLNQYASPVISQTVISQDMNI